MTLVCNLGAKGRLPRSIIRLESVYLDFPPLVVFARIIDPVLTSVGRFSHCPRCRESGGVTREMHQGGADVEASSVMRTRGIIERQIETLHSN